MRVEIGQKVKRVPSWGIKGSHDEKVPAITGYVRYIHPRRRYYMVEFQLPSGVLRECYFDREG